ncbi:MAG TPA: hypothetical protein VIS03_00010 [Kiloniellaceae bacterium]
MTDPTADDQSLMAPLRQALLDCAAAGATITYQELAQRASFPGPHTIHRLTLLLEAMAREDHAAGRPLLAALAVSRTQKGPDGGGIPGRGFFQLLTELGRYDGPDQGPEAAAQHARELQAALAYWARPG